MSAYGNPCDGSEPCFIECPICFVTVPFDLAVQTETDDGARSNATCVALPEAGCLNDGECGIGEICVEAPRVCLPVPADPVLFVPIDNGFLGDAAGGHTVFMTDPRTASDRFGAGDDAADLFAAGASGLITVPLAATEMTGAFTLALWVQLDAFGNFQNNNEQIAGVEGFFALHSRSGNADVRFGRLAGNSELDPDQNVPRSPDFPLGADWTFLAGVVEDAGATFTATLYVDGVAVDSRELPAGVEVRSGSCHLAVGAKSENGACNATALSDMQNPFPGNVDDIRLFDRALSANEIFALSLERGFAP